MLKRTLTGAAIVAVVVGFFFLRSVAPWTFLILISAIALVGNFEINKMFGEKTNIVQKIISFFATFLICLFFIMSEAIKNSPIKGITSSVIILICFGAITLFAPVFSKGSWNVESLALSVLSLIYPTAFLIPLFAMNSLGEVSLFALILTFSVSPCADVFAYLVGSLIKGKKLCEEISPHKTISGAIGGLIGGLVGSIVVYAIMKNTFSYNLSIYPYLYFGIVGFVAAILTEIGDLAESYLKRAFDVKDSGILFPGHGGMLDRVDGLIFASIFIYFVTVLL